MNPAATPGGRRPRTGLAARLRRGASFALALGVITMLLAGAASAQASFMATSHAVALIPSRGPTTPEAQMPISGTVSGIPGDSFDRFTFIAVPLASITAQALQRFDTVVLMQVSTAQLSAAQKATLSQFVTNGGKLIIHDSDDTTGNDYSWLPYPAHIGAGCVNCGAATGSSQIVANNGLISRQPAAPSYVNLTELEQRTDAIGDANLFETLDPHWSVSASVTDVHNNTGATVASASANGLMIYNGYDNDYVRPSSAPGTRWQCRQGRPPTYECPPPPSGVDWLGKMWYDELAQSWGAGVPAPSAPPAFAVGQAFSFSALGAPPNARCLRIRKLSLSLRKRHQVITQADAYVNRRHVLHVQGRNLRRLTLTKLPRRGGFTITIILTTDRGYHLITRRRYRGCS